ncbi:hypothetical protein BN59_03445 [Legionella massiliensis]|uniref:Uncharacterized protein n=1 Tax=Legionella massiliensis TaxID=1034943 RepID=A0A078L5C3_9GAMM|nr:hypothetical protein [Legionella massiliensis]CDZ79128.1 hypothetical protein BN59_03445 [Legionella massiliensis]CEE14866.1 hypothetical protein BN1094_03445 [Legionella massiliensis]
MKRREDSSIIDSSNNQNNKRARIESEGQITTIGQFIDLLSNNYEALSAYTREARIQPDLLEGFLYNYNLSVYSIEILKKLADSLNQSECYIAVMHLYFEKACAVGSYELVAYILEHCENLVPEHHELRPYKELFLAYLAAKERAKNSIH